MKRIAARAGRLAAFALALATITASGAGCAARTEIVLSLASDLSAGKDIDTMNLIVTDEFGGSTSETWTVGGASGVPLPGTLGLTPKGNDQATVTLTLEGLRGALVVVRRQATIAFVPSQTVLARLALRSACKGAAAWDAKCQSDATCVDGACAKQSIDGALLPRFADGDDPKLSLCGTVADAAALGLTPPADGASCVAGQSCVDELCVAPGEGS